MEPSRKSHAIELSFFRDVTGSVATQLEAATIHYLHA